ncbi:MAG: thioredoxin-disulfide reductase [Chloroflexota bacterium]|nr:thioredoxin-disulfide reductase [Chloroflexota bacterium]
MSQTHELIIVGGGPAGLTAGIYACRARMDVLLIEKGLVGGQIVNAVLVENYPGFPEGISGMDLGTAMRDQAEKLGLEVVDAEIVGIENSKFHNIVRTSDGTSYQAKAVIISGGSEHRKLGVSGEWEFLGKGVSYCATCDGAFFSDQKVAVIGGGDAAITEALFLTQLASRVTIVHRRDELRGSKILQEMAFSNPKIDFAWNSVVEGIAGDTVVRELKLKDVKSGGESNLEVDGVFIYVGLRPNTDYLKGLVPLDDMGHIICNELMEIEVPGLFAAGDIRRNSARQAIAAAGDGATAAISARKYLRGA